MKKQTQKQYEALEEMLDEIEEKTGYCLTWQGNVEPRYIKSRNMIMFQEIKTK
jgi:hypothetical protein